VWVTVVLAIYLLGIGWRWVMGIPVLEAAALASATTQADGLYVATVRADLAVSRLFQLVT
jgi:hypothetical protein